MPIPNDAIPGQVESARLRLTDALRNINLYEVEIQKKFALAAACFIFVLLVTVMSLTGSADAQPSSAPPSCLPATPLSPSSDSIGLGSCDLCRPLQGRPGSDLQRHRPRRERELRPHTHTPGVSRSQKHSFKSQLPHRKLEENQEGPAH